jgi:hypothetical protein
MDNFTQGYIIAALWSSTDDNGNPLDYNYNIEDIAPETLATMQEDCATFQAENADLLKAAYSYDRGTIVEGGAYKT